MVTTLINIWHTNFNATVLNQMFIALIQQCCLLLITTHMHMSLIHRLIHLLLHAELWAAWDCHTKLHFRVNHCTEEVKLSREHRICVHQLYDQWNRASILGPSMGTIFPGSLLIHIHEWHHNSCRLAGLVQPLSRTVCPSSSCTYFTFVDCRVYLCKALSCTVWAMEFFIIFQSLGFVVLVKSIGNWLPCLWLSTAH